MNSTNQAHFGHYIPFHPKLKQKGLRTSDQLVFGKLSSLIATAGKAFVCLDAFASEFGYAKETISRSLRRLADRGLIKYTGQKKHGFYPYIEIPEAPKNFTSPKENLSAIVDLPINAHRSPDQAEETRVNKNKQLESAECKNLETLKTFGISSKDAKHLIEKFPKERINRQIENLKARLLSNTEVKSKAGWLIKAINEDFQPSKILEEQKLLAQEETLRKATQMAKNADRLLSSGNNEEAIKIAQNSLEIQETSLAKEVIQKAQNEITKKQLQQEALSSIPTEAFAQILSEEEEKQRKSLLRLGITKFGEMAKKAAYFSAVERAVNASQK